MTARWSSACAEAHTRTPGMKALARKLDQLAAKRDAKIQGRKGPRGSAKRLLKISL